MVVKKIYLITHLYKDKDDAYNTIIKVIDQIFEAKEDAENELLIFKKEQPDVNYIIEEHDLCLKQKSLFQF